MDDASPLPAIRFRTVFISDVHLGTRGCQAELLLDFISHMECETLYLVGDIIDGWRLKTGWFWPQAHNDVVQKVLRMARKGTRVVYVPGNHDEFARDYCGLHFGGAELLMEAVHETADGKRLLVVHGDHFDGVVRYAKWLALLGDWAYAIVHWLNSVFNRVQQQKKNNNKSHTTNHKNKVKNAVQFVADFEAAVTEEARRRGLDGVICGHIHKADLRTAHGVLYANDGDWVESCTALVEHFDGRLEVLQWAKLRSWSMIERHAQVATGQIAGETAIA